MKCYLRWIFIAALVLMTIVVLVALGCQYDWTGFAGRRTFSGEVVPAKTLWDWLDPLIVPLVLAIGAFLLDGSRKRAEREVENDRQRQKTLEVYFAYISELIVEKSLLTCSGADQARGLARTWTLTARRKRDGGRIRAFRSYLSLVV